MQSTYQITEKDNAPLEHAYGHQGFLSVQAVDFHAQLTHTHGNLFRGEHGFKFLDPQRLSHASPYLSPAAAGRADTVSNAPGTSRKTAVSSQSGYLAQCTQSAQIFCGSTLFSTTLKPKRVKNAS